MPIFRSRANRAALSTSAAPPPVVREISIPSRAAGDSPYLGEPPAALALPTAFRCAQLLAHTVGNLPAQVRAGDVRLASPLWLRHPESFGSPPLRRLISGLVVDQALYGSGYLQADPVGVSYRLTLIPAATVGVSFDNYGKRTYRVDGHTRPALDPGSETSRAAGGLIPVPFLTLPGKAEPVSPIGAARLALAGYLDTDRFAARVFAAGRGQTGGHLETDLEISEESATRYRDAWVKSQGDPASSSIPVLGGGLRYATDTIDPRDAQWIESRGYNSTEIARLFGLPPRFLGLPSGDSVTYATARDNDAAFIRFTLAPYIAEIESALSSLLPFGRTEAEDQRIVLNTDSLLRSTTEDRWAAYSTALSAGFLTVDEVRRSEGLPPLSEPADTVETEPISPGVTS